MRCFSNIILLSVAILLLSACGAETAMKKGDKFFALGEYYDAASQYKKAYSQTKSKDKPLRGQRALKMADCYRRINQTQRAMAAYNNALRFHQADSMAVFYLGQLQMMSGNYKEAERTFSSLLDGTLVLEETKDAEEDITTLKGRKARAKEKEKTAKEIAKEKEKAAKEKAKEKAKAAKERAKERANAAKEKAKAAKEKAKAREKERKAAAKEKAAERKARLSKSKKGTSSTEIAEIPVPKETTVAKEDADVKEAPETTETVETPKSRKSCRKAKVLEETEENKDTKETKESKKAKKAKDSKEAKDSLSVKKKSKKDSVAVKPRPIPDERLVKVGLESARMAPKWKAEAEYSGYTVKKQEFFNSRRAEYSPALCGDDSDQLFFSSTRNQAKGDEYSGITGMKNADIFFSQKDEKGKWSKPEVIDSDLNSEDDEGACTFSPDGKTMYLTVCKTDPNYPRYAQIATSQRSDASWGKATVQEITRDTLSTFAHPTVSPDGMWLYFVSDMPGGLGGYDIWRIQMTGSGFVGLENVGEPVNTPGNEMFPTFRPNGDLYFSSDGHPGFGGLDIFIAKPTPDPSPGEGSLVTSTLQNTSEQTNQTPLPSGGVGGGLPPSEEGMAYVLEHPGWPLNSPGDDFGMTFEGLHNRGYFSSNRGDARGWDHIYSFEKHEVIQTVRGWVYEQDGYELPAAQVYMVGNDGTNLKLSVRGDGSFEQEIKPYVSYVFLGTCKGYLNHKEELRVEPVLESQEYTLQFPLANISAPVLIENIFYDFDKATLRPESTEALDKLVALLNENPNVTIELSSHTDNRGSDQYNEGLSQRRAESVVNYLIDHGIAADRLTPKGYGEGRPKTVKRKLTERYDWLKTDDVLTEEFINALGDEEKQEICHQLNRRTEFIVLRTTYGMFDAEGKVKALPPAKAKVEEEKPQQEELW